MKVRMLWIMVLVCQMESVAAQTGIWQWSVPVRYFSSHPKNPVARAYLWIPEQCRQVKALLVAQHNMEEISILEDQAFRQRMAEMDGAQVWVCPSFNHGFDFTDGAWCPFVVPVCPVRFRAAGGLLRGVGPGLCGRKPTDIHTDSAQGYLSGGGDCGGLAVWTQAAYCDSDGRTGQKDILNEITRYTL